MKKLMGYQETHQGTPTKTKTKSFKKYIKQDKQKHQSKA